MLAFDIGLDASLADEPFTTPGVNPVQIDTWKQAVRNHASIGLSKARNLTSLQLWFSVSMEARCFRWGIQKGGYQVRKLLLFPGCVGNGRPWSLGDRNRSCRCDFGGGCNVLRLRQPRMMHHHRLAELPLLHPYSKSLLNFFCLSAPRLCNESGILAGTWYW